MSFIDFLYQLDSWVWGMPLIVAVMILGAYYMIRGKFFPFVHFGHTWKNTILEKSDQTSADDSGKISPFRAFCLALGGAVLTLPAIFFLLKTPAEKGVVPYGADQQFFGCGYGPSLV